MKKNIFISVNFHLNKACNYKCKFCFSTFRSSKNFSILKLSEKKKIIALLRERGMKKINFAGGEPTLDRDLGPLIEYSKSLGLTTSVVTNGYKLKELLYEFGKFLDWVGLSIDSSDEKVNKKLGRGNGSHVKRCFYLAEICHKMGINLKVNTVVTSLNWRENMSKMIIRLNPKRWKVFQVLKIEGENDDAVDSLLISKQQFEQFVERHLFLRERGINVVFESNEDIIDSYLMVGPSGRFFGDTGGVYRESDPILKVGVEKALQQMQFKIEKLEKRGGIYDW